MNLIEPYWDNIIDKEEDIFIWGVNFLGEQVYHYCRERDVNIAGFIDDGENVGREFLGVEVRGKDYLQKNKLYVIVAMPGYDNEIIEYLFDNGYTTKNFCYLMPPIYSTEDIVYCGCRVGRYTYGYKELLRCFPMADSIGRYCSINGTACILNNHALDCVTTSPFLDDFRLMQNDTYLKHKFFVKKYGKYHNNHPFENSEIRNNKPVTIGNDVWIGANVCIMPGVFIGDGAVVAAGAVVCHDVEPYSIVGGVPARHIRYRFSKEQIAKFMKIKWWDWPHEAIEDNIELLYQPEKFLEKFYNEAVMSPTSSGGGFLME